MNASLTAGLTRTGATASTGTRVVEAAEMGWSDLHRLIEAERPDGGFLLFSPAAARVARLVGGPAIGGRSCLLVSGERSRHLAEWGQRTLDVTLALALIALCAPLLAVIAIAVKLSSRGPVFHRARVVGRGGVPFTWLKVRTMTAGARETAHREASRRFISGESIETDAGVDNVFKMTRDPRITPLGRWLRRHSLDELPQLFAVLGGQMSLVGPRPCLPYEWEMYAAHHRHRLAVRPGMTGLWQVAGRSRVTFEEMVLMDRLWAWNRSVRLYVSTLLRTIRVVVGGEGGF